MDKGSDRQRVVVTGVGAICSLGIGMDAIWNSAVAGRSGIATVTRCNTDDLATTIAGEVKEFDAAEVIGRKESRRLDRFSQFAIVTAREAVAMSGLTIASEPERIGTLIASAMGGMESIEAAADAMHTSGPRRVSPFFVPMMLANMATGNVAIDLGTTGPNFATVSACAASAHAIGEGARMIRDGMADAMIVGGAEAPITRLAIAGYSSLGALSTRNDAPERASRPFDAERDGFVLAEGSATLVLESFEHAQARGARVLGEVLGYGATDDANHMVQPAPGGVGAARAMTLALADAGVEPEAIGYINAHGTSTPLNEKLETMAMKRAFGDAAYRIPISSTKSMTGHLLGAAGALEAAIVLRAMEERMLPPTINQESPDPECDLDVIPNAARRADVHIAMSNSMGFGGHNVSLIFRSGV